MPGSNFNNSSINSNLIQSAQKGMQFNTPLSRFGPIRPLIVLEWTPLESVGRYGEPVRFPFFINPQSINFTHEHSYSQQQTRGGWVHTHWNDKPLMIKLHGNTGLYQQDFINVLRFYTKISGKTYLELDVYQKNKNTYRDKFLSEFLSPQDAQLLLGTLGSTTLPSSSANPNGGKGYGQSILQGLVTNDGLYQQAKTVGKIAFQNIQNVANIQLNASAIVSLSSDLNIVKADAQNTQSTNQNFNKNGQSVLKGSALNPADAVPKSDVSIKGVFQKLNSIPASQVMSAGLFSSPVDLAIVNPNGLAGVFGSIPIFNDNILITPGGIISARNQINSDATLRHSFSTPEMRFLQLSENVISDFASHNMRLDNPMQLLGDNLHGISSDLDFLLTYSTQLTTKGNSIISGLSLNDDIRSNINTLNDFLAQFMLRINDLSEELEVLKRKIKIQVKRFDSGQERKIYKKFNAKRDQILEDILTLFQLKDQIDNLILEPLAVTTDTTNQSNQASSLLAQTAASKIALDYIKARNSNILSKFTDVDSNTVSTIAQTELSGLLNNSDTTSPGAQANRLGAASLFTAFRKGHNLPLTGDISQIPPNYQSSFGNYIRDKMAGKVSGTNTGSSATTADGNPITKTDENAANTATVAAPAGFATIMDQLGVASKNIEERVKGQFSVSDTPILPTYNDVVTLKLYYNGTIYEGFITHFDWSEQAGTPNIEYDMEFLVEREFLGASLSTVPTSLQLNPKDTKVFTGGDQINPLAGSSSLPANVITSVSGAIITPGVRQSNSVGESNPQLHPAIGSSVTNPANPNPGSPGNTVNIPVKNFGTSDSSSLTQSNVNQVLRDGQLDLSDGT